jgi:hypothetical protein
MPIDGLSLESGRVMFNGIPLDQGSSAEQLRVSTAIAMSSNPELRVIRIKDGSLLDPDGRPRKTTSKSGLSALPIMIR